MSKRVSLPDSSNITPFSNLSIQTSEEQPNTTSVSEKNPEPASTASQKRSMLAKAKHGMFDRSELLKKKNPVIFKRSITDSGRTVPRISLKDSSPRPTMTTSDVAEKSNTTTSSKMDGAPYPATFGGSIPTTPASEMRRKRLQERKLDIESNKGRDVAIVESDSAERKAAIIKDARARYDVLDKRFQPIAHSSAPIHAKIPDLSGLGLVSKRRKDGQIEIFELDGAKARSTVKLSLPAFGLACDAHKRLVAKGKASGSSGSSHPDTYARLAQLGREAHHQGLTNLTPKLIDEAAAILQPQESGFYSTITAPADWMTSAEASLAALIDLRAPAKTVELLSRAILVAIKLLHPPALSGVQACDFVSPGGLAAKHGIEESDTAGFQAIRRLDKLPQGELQSTFARTMQPIADALGSSTRLIPAECRKDWQAFKAALDDLNADDMASPHDALSTLLAACEKIKDFHFEHTLLAHLAHKAPHLVDDALLANSRPGQLATLLAGQVLQSLPPTTGTQKLAQALLHKLGMPVPSQPASGSKPEEHGD